MENETLISSSLATQQVRIITRGCDHNRRNTEQISHGPSAVVLSLLSLNGPFKKTSPRLIILELLNFNQCANYICLDVLDGPQIQNAEQRFRPLRTFNVTHTQGGGTLWPSAKSLL